MYSDIEIAKKSKILEIKEVAKKIDIFEDELEFYGKYKAKISFDAIKRVENNKNGKLVLVTAINPTPMGEGKTTVSIGLTQALNLLGKKSVAALREPSLGPCFGIKGGAAGGGYSQVIPMEDLNLHFTGDFHAITSANNLLCALLDNHIYQGNELNIDERNIVIKRCLDINDRNLRNVIIGLGAKTNGKIREDSFVITVATEIMAILCLAKDIEDLKEKLENIIVAYTYDKKPVYVKDLNAVGSILVLLKDAIKPNLVQTLENTPVLVHGGPFANIAHGCNSIIATKFALKVSDVVVTEAGFGADLGAEKFLNIKCRKADLKPDAIVLVATLRALKYNAYLKKDEIEKENIIALKKGLVNLEKHIDNLKLFNIPIVVTLNAFSSDTEKEYEVVRELCEKKDCKFTISKVWAEGGKGGLDLANTLLDVLSNNKANIEFLYDINIGIKDKINQIATKIYGAKTVNYTDNASKKIEEIENLGYKNLPVCMAKTQFSFSDDPKLLGAPKDFTLNIRDVYINAGAGFIVVITKDIMTMPGLPKVPAANSIDLDKNFQIVGLF